MSLYLIKLEGSHSPPVSMPYINLSLLLENISEWTFYPHSALSELDCGIDRDCPPVWNKQRLSPSGLNSGIDRTVPQAGIDSGIDRDWMYVIPKGLVLTDCSFPSGRKMIAMS